MSAIDDVFTRCAQEKRPAFIPFLMAGDPTLERTPDLLAALAQGGADLIEVGVPFSDPVADGPVNQRAAARALASGTTLSAILRSVARHRERIGVPLVLFSYFNPILARGLGSFAEQAASSGVDGVLCVDLPPDESADEWLPALGDHSIDPVFLLAPTSTRARVAQVAAVSRGFVYYVSRTGVTGEQDLLPEGLIKGLRRVRRRLNQPVAVGFGISTPQQVAALRGAADGIVVGSALVRQIEEQGDDPELARSLEGRVRELADATRGIVV